MPMDFRMAETLRISGLPCLESMRYSCVRFSLAFRAIVAAPPKARVICRNAALAMSRFWVDVSPLLDFKRAHGRL